MDVKLTLKLNQVVIERAKKYASSKQLSLSRIVEAYLKSITSETEYTDIEISPFVRSMATGAVIPLELDTKKEFSDYLLDKYK